MNWKLCLKIVVTGLAIFLVGRQIDLAETFRYIMTLPVVITLGSVVIYNFTRYLGALRLNYLFRKEEILISERDNLKLYYKGLFYNLFLPGGVGGDGYKVYLIHNRYNTPVRKILRAVLWDRIGGVVAIGFLSLPLVIFLPVVEELVSIRFLVLCAVFLTYPVFLLITHFLFPWYRSVFLSTTLLALGIQISQGLIAVLILMGMGVTLNNMDEYILVYFVSTLATVLPITLGGIGIRELVFIKAAQFTSIDQQTAVAFSVVFFAIHAFSSLAGSFVKVTLQPRPLESGV